MCSRLFQAESPLARSFSDVHDGKISIDDQGRLRDSLAVVREDIRRSILELSAGMALSKDASQLRIDVRDAHGARVMTATMVVVIEGPFKDPRALLPSKSEPSFDESLGSQARRTREVGITRQGLFADSSVLAPPSTNQG